MEARGRRSLPVSPHASAARSVIRGEPMETSLDTTLFFVIFVTATFAASLVAGSAGFAFALVAAATWLYILTPLQTATLIIWFGLIVQGYAVWLPSGAGRSRILLSYPPTDLLGALSA